MSALVRGGALSLGGSVLGRVAGMAQSIVIARGLDPHRLGVFSILNYVLALGGAIVDLGVPVAATKLVAEYRVTRPTALRRIIGILAVLSLLLATAGAGAEETVTAVLAAVDAFEAGRPRDDLALVLVHVAGPEPGREPAPDHRRSPDERRAEHGPLPAVEGANERRQPPGDDCEHGGDERESGEGHVQYSSPTPGT